METTTEQTLTPDDLNPLTGQPEEIYDNLHLLRKHGHLTQLELVESIRKVEGVFVLLMILEE